MVTLPLTGEPLALDLLNTTVSTPGRQLNFIADAASLRRWLGLEQGRITELDAEEIASLTDADATRVMRLRKTAAALIEPARKGEQPEERAIGRLNSVLRSTPGTEQLQWTGNELASSLRRKGSPGSRLLTALAEEVASLLTDESITRVKKCESSTCVMLFLPLNPRRRWCVPEVCGNRARTTRYYLRHKGKS